MFYWIYATIKKRSMEMDIEVSDAEETPPVQMTKK